jgi:hypothetical protein
MGAASGGPSAVNSPIKPFPSLLLGLYIVSLSLSKINFSNPDGTVITASYKTDILTLDKLYPKDLIYELPRLLTPLLKAVSDSWYIGHRPKCALLT